MSSFPAFDPPADTPAWFLNAIARPRSSHVATTGDGARIHYVCWNDQDRHKPSLLFIHGFCAHAHVWDFIAPFFIERFRVIAMDLSGMGDSAWREEYSHACFVKDMRAVIDHAELTPVTIVGHSFGGAQMVGLAAEQPEILRRAIVVDSLIPLAGIDGPRKVPQFGRSQLHADYASITSRYRLLPDQPVPAWSKAYVAHHSVREVEGGWSWKFDASLPQARIEFDAEKSLGLIEVPVDYICGASSAIVEPIRAQRTTDAIGQGRGAIVIPEAGHHIMLDQPLAFVSALRALLN